MTPKQELKIAYWLAIIFLVVGVLSYSAFSAKAPDEPVRLMFKCVAGKVLFDHKTHSAESGYGIACTDCHHHPENDDSNRACSACHVVPEDGSAPQSCMECHEAGDFEVSEIMKKSDAFHKQCAGCHEEKGAGPKKDECGSCHVMSK